MRRTLSTRWAGDGPCPRGRALFNAAWKDRNLLSRAI
jgi:hypothetical protein